MNPESCRPWRERLGSLALGHLGPEEEAAVRAHVDGCTACRGELAELSQVAAVLPLADADRLDERPMPPSDLGDRIVARVREERETIRRQGRRRGTARTVAAIAAAAAIVLVLVFAPRGSDAERVAFSDEPPGVVAEAALTERPWGIEVALDVEGLPQGETYRVWLRRDDGEREPVGSFRGAGRPLHVVLAAAISRSATVGVGVSDADGETVMYAHLEDEEMPARSEQ